MASLSYEDIFSDFLGNVTDYQLASLDINDATTLLVEYLHKALSDPYIRHIFSSATLDDEIQIFTYELDYKTNEDADKYFVKYVLSKGMVMQWIQPQVTSKTNLAQMFGGKEQQFFSQSNHIEQLRGLQKDTDMELRKIVMDRGYIYNSYLGNG